MARRYSGALTVELYYRPGVRLGCTGQDWYYCRVTMGRKADVMNVHAPAAGFGPGVAYDSPEAYDRIARAAIGLADPALSDYAEWAKLGEPQASGRLIEWTDVEVYRNKTDAKIGYQEVDRRVRAEIAKLCGDYTQEERERGRKDGV